MQKLTAQQLSPLEAASRAKQCSRRTLGLWFARCSSIADELATAYMRLLSEEERQRNARYRFASDRHRDLLARALLRTTLGFYLDTDPASLVFAAGEHGKPGLVGIEGSGLEFNLSHAGDFVVLAVSQGPRIGIDIEFVQRSNDVLAIAHRYFFGAEIEELFSFPEHERRDRFFDYWTLKEAYMKARGEGISLGLENFGFSVGNPGTIAIQMNPCLDDNPANWQFICSSPEQEYRLALAYESTGTLAVEAIESVPLEHYIFGSPFLQ